MKSKVININARYYLSGQFIQPWIAEEWTDQDWANELNMMKSIGMEYLILTPIVYKDENKYYSVFYESSLAEFQGCEKNNLLEKCLRHCKAVGIKLFLDPYQDQQWWDYGWEWESSGPLSQSGFRSYMTSTRTLANKITDEILLMYGHDYSDTIVGWYWGAEVWNIAMTGSDKYLKILSSGLNMALDHYSEVCPGKPMLMSPFVNTSLYGTSANKLYKQWKKIFSLTRFRNGDIICPQDSVGAGGMPFDDNGATLKLWTKAYADALATANVELHFWSNNENFTPEETPCSIERFINQLKITGPYVEKHVTYSYSEFYSPYQVDPSNHEAYKIYLQSSEDF